MTIGCRNQKLAFSEWIWHKTAVPIFIERVILPLFVVTVFALVVTNPMSFDWTQRITGALVLLFLAYFLAHTLHLRSQQKATLEQQPKVPETQRQDIRPVEPTTPIVQDAKNAARRKSNDEEGKKSSEVRNPPYVGIGEVRDTPNDKIQVPKIFRLNIGNNDRDILREQLARQVPFEELGLMEFRGKVPFSIWFDEQAALKVNTVIYSLERTVLAAVNANEIDKHDMTLDRNWDASALEIVTSDNQVLLQVDHSIRGLIRIRGMFVSAPFYVVGVTDHGVIAGSVRLGAHGTEWAAAGDNESERKVAFPIKPIFRYPSDKYFHVRVGQNP